MTFDKKQLFKLFENQIAADIHMFTQAALSAHEAATHTESKAEDQYDTRGLEASYLAGAQSKRVMELEQLLTMYRHIDIKYFTKISPIAATAVIELEHSGKTFVYLLMPSGGGRSVIFDEKTISVITPQAPLGEAVLEKRVGDSVEVTIQNTVRDYEIINIWLLFSNMKFM